MSDSITTESTATIQAQDGAIQGNSIVSGTIGGLLTSNGITHGQDSSGTIGENSLASVLLGGQAFTGKTASLYQSSSASVSSPSSSSISAGQTILSDIGNLEPSGLSAMGEDSTGQSTTCAEP